MVTEIQDDLYTEKHYRLIHIAMIANIFAWIVFVTFIFLAGAKLVETQSKSLLCNTSIFAPDDINWPMFFDLLKRDTLLAVSLVIELMSILLKGVVYGMVLKGISLGLNMIVEIDLNYKEKIQERVKQ